jgi:hypothetical protein
MGSDNRYSEEVPVLTLGDFWIDRRPVTNRQLKNYPGALPHMFYAGYRSMPAIAYFHAAG